MARRKVPQQPLYPYNIGGRCINKDWFAIPMEEVWLVMSEQLTFIHHAFDIKILAFVLMNNHFHLTVQTPNSNLSVAMEWFMRESSRTLTKLGNRTNQTYGSRFFRSMMSTHHYFLNAYKYIYYNPVKAKICDDVIDYPFSTLGGLLGQRRIHIPIEEDLTLFSDVNGTLDWLNTRPTDSNWEAVRKALKKSEFKFSRENARNHELETSLL